MEEQEIKTNESSLGNSIKINTVELTGLSEDNMNQHANLSQLENGESHVTPRYETELELAENVENIENAENVAIESTNTENAWNNAQDGDATDMETAAGDVTEQATNAGNETAADGGALRSKFNSRDGASINVESDLRDGSFDAGNPENPQEQIPTELLNPVGVLDTLESDTD